MNMDERLTFRYLRALALVAALSTAASCPASSQAPQTSSSKAVWTWREVKLGAVPEVAGAPRGQPVLEAHGWHYGLVVRTAQGERFWLDGTNQPVFRSIGTQEIMDAGLVYDYAFSPDGAHLAYPVYDKGGMRMVLDGTPGPLYERVARPVFSPDGQRLAYEIQKQGVHYVLLEGRAGPACDAVWGG